MKTRDAAILGLTVLALFFCMAADQLALEPSMRLYNTEWWQYAETDKHEFAQIGWNDTTHVGALWFYDLDDNKCAAFGLRDDGNSGDDDGAGELQLYDAGTLYAKAGWDLYDGSGDDGGYFCYSTDSQKTAAILTLNTATNGGFGAVAVYNDADSATITLSGNTGNVTSTGAVQAADYKSGDGTQGATTTAYVQDGDDAGPCTMTFKDGLLTASDCMVEP
jgi:hypothetical protein